MNRIRVIMLLLLIAFGFSCTSRKNKVDRTGIIPARDLIEIIAEVHITDGVLAIPDIRRWYIPEDSVAAYRSVVEKRGYTLEDLNKTMKLYFVKKPEQLLEIYDKVLAKLSEMESRMEKEVNDIQTRMLNLWRGHSRYILPDPSGNDSTMFDITVQHSGRYYISFTLTAYPDDQTPDPRFMAYSCHPDSIETGRRHYISSLPYARDGYPHNYSYVITLNNNTGMHMRGWLYQSTGDPVTSSPNAIIEDISVTYGRME